jgi:hypothetical protein
MTHNRNLEFEGKPDYDYLINLMTTLAEKEGLEIGGDQGKQFDWFVKGMQY